MLRQNISRFPALIGWPGGIGVALLGAAMLMYFSVTLPLHNEIVSLHNEIEQVSSGQKQSPHTVSAAEIHKQLDHFTGSFPQHDSINDVLNQLHDLAATYHLTLKNSEYRTSQNSKAGVIRQLRISIKSEGNYTDLRNFLRKIPQEIPALAIEQLSMNRQKISDTKVETTVEFDLFYSPTELKHTETDDLPLAKKS